MTIVEAGIIAGAPAGAVIGAVVGRTHGTTGLVGGILAGLVSGIVAGWVYALFVLALLAVVGVLLRALLKRKELVPTISEIAVMSPLAAAGTFTGIVATLFGWLSVGILPAAVLALAFALLTAIVANSRGEIR